MKKIFNILTVGAFVAMSASCAKEIINTDKAGGNSEGTVAMSILAVDETSAENGKTLLGNFKEGKYPVVFTSNDKLFVFGEKDGSIKGVQFKADGKGRKESYNFTTSNWPVGYTPIYAITSTLSDTVKQVCTADGKVTLKVDNAAQKLEWSGSYATNTTAHVGKVEEGAVVLKNVCGLINFSVENEDITKIVVSGNGGEALGGWISADYGSMSEDSIGFFTPGAETVKSISLTVGETLDNGDKTVNGLFPTDTSFFISILPGEYTSGLTFRLFNSKGESATRIINTPLRIKRSQVRAFNAPLDRGLEFKGAEMPDTVVLSLAGRWPFVENIVPAKDQKAEGDEYTFNYTSEEGYSAPFKFRIHDGGTAATGYTTSASEMIKFTGNDGYVQFPAIEGRVLRSVTLLTRNATPGKSYAISETTTGKELAEGTVAKEDVVLTWYSDGRVKTKPNTAYYLRCLQSSSMYTKIEAVYVKELSPTPVTVPEEFTAVIDFSESWPFVQPAVGRSFQVAAGPDCDGEVYDFIYSEDAVLKVGICKGKVNTYVPVNPDNVAGTPGCLNFGRVGSSAPYEDNEGFVKTPAIPGRYLKEVKIVANVSASNHNIIICKSNQKETSGDGVLASFGAAAYPNSASSGELDGEVNTPYYIFRNLSTAEKYVRIELTYSTRK